MNFRYLDKNFGEFLIIWDKLFGTFEEETDKVVYGMYSHPQSWNPIKIYFHYYQILWKDAVDAPYWIDKIKLWFMPLGWRPRGLPDKPALVETTPQNKVRYSSVMFEGAKPYLILHCILSLALMMPVIKSNSDWSFAERWVGAGLLWFQIVNWSGIMESKSWVLISEFVRITLTVSAFIVFSSLSGLIAASVVGVGLLSVVWCWRYFRVATFTI